MNLPAKKPSMDVSFPDLAGLPEMFSAALPPSIPQINYGSGLVKNFFHNWRLEQLERASASEARIAENNLQQLVARFAAIQELLTFNQQYELRIRANRHQMRMLEITQQRAEAELFYQQLKNVELQAEAKMAQLDLEMRLKEAKDGLAETEDN